MARIRTLKPEFWTDGNMVQLSFEARLFYVGTWNFALCDAGHLPDDPMGLKLKILPADQVDPFALVDELVKLGRLVRKQTAEGRAYLHIVRLSDHQKTDARWQSRCPFCLAESKGDANGSAPPHQNTTSHDESRQASPELAGVRASHDETHQNSSMEGKGKECKGIKNTSSPASPSRASDQADADPVGEDPNAIPGLPSLPGSAHRPTPGSDEDPYWLKYWSLCPQKVGKPEARKAWAKAVKKTAPFVIIAGLERYVTWLSLDPRRKQFIKNPSGWLNGERWNDELDMTPTANASGFASGTGARAGVSTPEEIENATIEEMFGKHA